MKKQNNVELLAPAGGLIHLKAAVENGADAVYMGGHLFNARINAENFTKEALLEGLEYAHVRGVKIYITMNTLIRDSELQPALEYAAFLYQNGADALILQDLGFANLVREQIPDFPIHFSTQGTIYNQSGVDLAASLGFSRVVLARETSLEEITAIAKDTAAEIEVFVHGALCICYSGQCEMSYMIGGRSGNRGTCAQPCRLPYTLQNKEEKHSGYLLSPKDLCLIDLLDLLVNAGVTSFKIEGRMKSPEYVAAVTGIYRKYLDLAATGKPYRVAEEDKQILLQMFNRGGFNQGYLFHDYESNLMAHDIPKNQGVYAGFIKHSNPKKKLIEVQNKSVFSIGDVVEIRGNTAEENLTGTVTFIEEKEGSYLLGDIYVPASYQNNKVYKMKDQLLVKKLQASFLHNQEPDRGKKIPLSGMFSAAEGRPLRLKLWDQNGNHVEVASEYICETAQNKAAEERLVMQHLSKTGGTPFVLTSCEVALKGALFVPVSEINQLRRKALEEIYQQRKTVSEHRNNIYIKEGLFQKPDRNRPQNLTEPVKTLYLFELDHNETGEGYDEVYLPYTYFLEPRYQPKLTALKKAGIRLIPTLPQITKGWHDSNIKANFSEIVAVAKEALLIGNLGWSSAFKAAGVKLYADMGLNLYNSVTLKQLKELGFSGGILSPELALEDILSIYLDGFEAEILSAGQMPAMVTAHKIKGETLYDRMGAAYPVLNRANDDFSIILGHRSENLSSSNIQKLLEAGIKRFRTYG